VLEALAKVEPLYKGVVVVGFPNDCAQADAAFKRGFLPERTFVVEVDNAMESYLKKSHEHATYASIRAKMTRNALWQKELL
jgi:hypothetical protein